MKTVVKNQRNMSLSVMVEGEDHNRLAFVIHGLGGFKEQVHIRTMAEAFLENGYTVITYDAANTIGESDGKMEDATLTNYYEDLEDVVSWSSSQSWYKEPFVLAGHSLGAACSIMFAAKHPHKVKAIAPISCFVAGELYEKTLSEEELVSWQAKGYQEEESLSKPGMVKRISWNFLTDSLGHDMRKLASEVKCPTLLVVGSEDIGTPVEHQQQLVDKIRQSELHIIKGMQHNPRSKEHNAELKSLLTEWLNCLS